MKTASIGQRAVPHFIGGAWVVPRSFTEKYPVAASVLGEALGGVFPDHTVVSLGKAAHRCDAPCAERCVLAGPGKSSARGGLFKDADGKWRRT